LYFKLNTKQSIRVCGLKALSRLITLSLLVVAVELFQMAAVAVRAGI
jgi:hypothetical protein